jgi:hypothetical protein
VKPILTFLGLLAVSLTVALQVQAQAFPQTRSQFAKSVRASWDTPLSATEFDDIYELQCSSNYLQLEARYKAEVESLAGNLPEYLSSKNYSCGISGIEFWAIRDYMRNDYVPINTYLRGASKSEDQVSKKTIDQIRLIQIGLQKVSSYTGFIRRNIHSFSGMDKLYREGTIITELGFLSATVVKPNPVQFGSTRILIKSKKRCHAAWRFGLYKDEGEVLCESGTKFRVLLNEKISREDRMIYLEEVDS